MIFIKLFDLHCDTLYEIYKKNESLAYNDLNISLEKAKMFDSYTQIMAIFSEHDLSDELAYNQFFDIYSYYVEDSKKYDKSKYKFYLAVEGGKILCNDLERLSKLYEVGVRFLTLVWKDICCIGGAYNTHNGLTEFGERVVNKCLEIGIVPDVSHSSQEMFFEVADIAKRYNKPFIASHSNSYSIMNHMRNLTDEMFTMIKNCDGIVGISLAPQHLTDIDKTKCDILSIIKHIEHYLNLDGENIVCLGCDFDGVNTLPDGIESVSDLYKLADELSKMNYSNELIEKIFYVNANNFVDKLDSYKGMIK